MPSSRPGTGEAAEREGFEPPGPETGPAAFKAAAINLTLPPLPATAGYPAVRGTDAGDGPAIISRLTERPGEVAEWLKALAC